MNKTAKREEKMSVRFKILKTVYKLSGIKRMFGLPQEKLFAKAAQLNAKRGFAVPTDKSTFTQTSGWANAATA